ncbi:MAG: cytidine deaminase [Gemmatimonadales bacterium]
MADQLRAAAVAARAQAYCPYSGYAVGAALEATDGRVFVGCNVENASYGVTLCAERSALTAAIAAGARQFRRIAIVAGSDPAVAPCGACRQMLSEFGTELVVESFGPAGSRRWILSDLLPDAFGSQDVRSAKE